MADLIGEVEISTEALEQMVAGTKSMPGARYAAYQNHALDSSDCGGMRFLAIGPNCTLQEPPPRYPDTPSLGVGWRYLHVGWVNLETGKIE
jgi:hypothetical protein